MRGTFYGVGVGPGNPELLTLEALQVLKSCPVLAVPETRKGTERALQVVKAALDLSDKTLLPLEFVMERNPEHRQSSYEDSAEKVRNVLDSGRDVAMITLGDATLYSTVQYIQRLLEADGYSTVLVPGISSVSASAARLNRSLTELDTEVHILPAGADPDRLREALRLPGTKVLMKAGRQLPAVYEILKEEQLLEQTSLVADCGLSTEHVIANWAEEPDTDFGYFVTLIVKETP